MDNLEKDLLNLKNEDITIPPSVLNKIDTAFDTIRNDNSNDLKCVNLKSYNKKTKSKKRKYYLTAASLALATTIGLSSPVRAAIEQFVFSFKNPGIESAVKNDYVQKISDTEVSSDKFNMNLNNILVDSGHIALDFEIKIKDNSMIPEDLNQFGVTMDVDLYNENGEIIYKTNTPVSNLALSGYSILDKSNIENNILNFKILLTSDSAKIPTMDTLKINVEKIVFAHLVDTVILSQDLNFETSIKLDDKFKEGKNINYSFNNDNPNIKVYKATSLPTSMNLEFDYLVAGDEAKIVHRATLVDENNKRYISSSASTETLPGGGATLKIVFDGITSFDNANKFTLEIENPNGSTVDKVEFNRMTLP
ncbi:hypothetical protein [Clostridium frigidicarnis]|uniref:DUF4179 domain-containing protein n=1 Tax=Clostridium frigidicarnis TaxID=84698 RepID=A0A1I0ZY71_9CLOT|nr:hypothetical protein [Clostridium frigidicarnis]SFB30497.1 hypothetical protein SAMN04488528_102721 [Clostridium frigidicarnis]